MNKNQRTVCIPCHKGNHYCQENQYCCNHPRAGYKANCHKYKLVVFQQIIIGICFYYMPFNMLVFISLSGYTQNRPCTNYKNRIFYLRIHKCTQIKYLFFVICPWAVFYSNYLFQHYFLSCSNMNLTVMIHKA